MDPASNIPARDPARTALVIIDMLNEYLDPSGKVYCEKCGEIIPALNLLIREAERRGVAIIFCNTELSGDGGPLARKWGLHAEARKWGSRLYKEIISPPNSLVVPKQLYDGFFKTELHQTLQNKGVSSIAICGIHTHVCVLITATTAFEYGYDVSVISDCITTAYKPNHDSRLRFFKTHVGELVESQDWLTSLVGK